MSTRNLPAELQPLSFLPERVLRFIDIDPDSDHLLWTASTTPGNYPRASRNGKLTMLARWVLEETVGPCPGPAWSSSHKCHDEQNGACPPELPEFCFHRLCLQPEHLIWEPLAENIMASSRTRAYQLANGLMLPPRAFRARPEERRWAKDDDTELIYADL